MRTAATFIRRLASSFYFYSTKSPLDFPKPLTKERSTGWPRPSEIPWQTKVANSVNLIGSVQIPVQFETSPDGKPFAGTVVAQHSSSSGLIFWIPVIFEGDLAHVAACHVKERDLVYVSGRLSMDFPSSTIRKNQANVQVLVDDISFVQGSSEKSYVQLEHDDEFEVPSLKQEKYCLSKNNDTLLSSWRDLVENPKCWLDYREQKMKKLVKEKHPDFKHKNSGLALWLDRAPKWLLNGLEGLEFESINTKASKREESWKSLVENPEKWWDNRSNKANVKAPDFKHKETGEGIWIDSLPDWVVAKLPAERKIPFRDVQNSV